MVAIATYFSIFGPHLTHDSLGAYELTTQTASRWVQPVYTYDRRVSLYITMGRHFPS